MMSRVTFAIGTNCAADLNFLHHFVLSCDTFRGIRRPRNVWTLKTFHYTLECSMFIASDSGWTRGVQVKLWDPLRTRAIPERSRRGAIQIHVYLYLTLPTLHFHRWSLKVVSPSFRMLWHTFVWALCRLVTLNFDLRPTPTIHTANFLSILGHSE